MDRAMTMIYLLLRSIKKLRLNDEIKLDQKKTRGLDIDISVRETTMDQ